MSTRQPTVLEEFHQFIGQQLAADEASRMTPEEALALWRERRETIAAIREGLADFEAGRTQSLEEFVADFRTRHGLAGE